MTTRRRILVAAGLSAWLLTPAHASAHHSVTGQFDASKPVTLRGVITRLTWKSPHIWIYLDVAESNAGVVNWAVEGAPPAILRDRPWLSLQVVLDKLSDLSFVKTIEGLQPAGSGQCDFGIHCRIGRKIDPLRIGVDNFNQLVDKAGLAVVVDAVVLYEHASLSMTTTSALHDVLLNRPGDWR